MKRLFERLGLATVVLAFGLVPIGDSPPLPAAPPMKFSTFARNAGTILVLGANQSSNWSGYNQGLLEKGALLTSVSGDWIVPTATQHTGGQPENSSAWVGIGGGCLETTCLPGLQDPTLIQAGTNHDVDAGGNPSYSAWWEIIPLPQILVPSFAVYPGQHIRVTITQIVPELWEIAIEDSAGQTFTTTVPYASAYGTAEWILETPTVISSDTGVGLASMPNLGTVSFFNSKVGQNLAAFDSPNFVPQEKIELTDVNGCVIAEPSDPGAASFSVQTHPSSC